jgi:hypothetical protein
VNYRARVGEQIAGSFSTAWRVGMHDPLILRCRLAGWIRETWRSQGARTD